MATKALVQPRTPTGHEALATVPFGWVNAWHAEVDAGALEALKPAIDNGDLEVISSPQGEAKGKG